MAVKIDRKLNFVSTITRDDGSLVYLHIVPFPYEVVEENCVLLGNLFNNFFSLVGSVGAPRVAAMMLRKIIKARQEAGDLQPGTPNTGKFTVLICRVSAQVIRSYSQYNRVRGKLTRYCNKFWITRSVVMLRDLLFITIPAVMRLYPVRNLEGSVNVIYPRALQARF